MTAVIILSILSCFVFDTLTCRDWDKRGYRRERLVVQAVAHITIIIFWLTFLYQ